jgi:hyperosmotically inducible protein
MLKKEHPGLIAVHEDRQLEEAILSALAAERLLEVEDLRVLVVERVAYVDGRASSYRRKQAIGKRARSVVGLRKVVNRLRVVPEAHVQDQALAERARTALAANPFLKEEDITVRCRDRAIELSGTVDAASLRLLAEDVVWSIGGVRHVNNELKVSFSRALQEQELAQRIEQVLLYSLDLEPWEISVQVERGTVHLRGRVPSHELAQTVEDLVRWHPQTEAIVNHLMVEETPTRLDHELPA